MDFIAQKGKHCKGILCTVLKSQINLLCYCIIRCAVFLSLVEYETLMGVTFAMKAYVNQTFE